MPDRIHNFEMLRLSGKPLRPGEQWISVVRAGTNGTGLWGTGHRAEPFNLVSVAITSNITTACQLYFQYNALRGLNPVEIEFAGYQEPNVLYKVLDVQPLQGEVRQQLRGVKAGSAANWQGWIVCSWLVLPINEVVP